MTEKITSLRAQSGGATAGNLSRKWQALPKSMKRSMLRLLLLLGILFVPALSTNAQMVAVINSVNQEKNVLKYSQYSDGYLVEIQMNEREAWKFCWEQTSKNPWDGLMRFKLDNKWFGDRKGYNVQFKIWAAYGYKILKVIFRDTEGCSTFRKPDGIDRLNIEAANYDKRFDKNAFDNYVPESQKGDFRDDNNLVFENNNGQPLQTLTFRTHNKQDGDEFKFRMIMVILKRERQYQFSQIIPYNLKVGDRVNNVFSGVEEDLNQHDNIFTYNPQGVVRIIKDPNDGYVAVADKAGSTTVTASLPEDNNYYGFSVNATFNVSLYDQTANLSTSDITMNAWETRDVPAVQDMPEDYPNAVNWKSSDESVAKIQNGKIVFGGTGYGKTATFTAELPQTDKYYGKTLRFNVRVNNEIQIASKADWAKFCQQVTGGNSSINATLTNNITDPVTTSAGTTEASYSGIFEGGNHSIALRLNGTQYTAPFVSVDGATIRNLIVTGNISASGKYAGSLVALVKGNGLNIERCQSSVAISSSVNGDGTHGGLVGLANVSMNITNSIFSGSIKGEKTNCCGGLVGWIDANAIDTKISNCLITATFTVGADGSDAVARHFWLYPTKNVYFLNSLGNQANGSEKVSAEQLENGYVAWHLQNGQSEQFWGQTINTSKNDATPLLSGDASKKVYRVAHVSSLDDKVIQEKFYNSRQPAQDLAASSFSWYVNTYKDPTRWYEVIDEGTVPSSVSSDQDVEVSIADEEFIGINSADTWKQFCDYVNDVSPKVTAKMTSNVTLDANSPMAGTKQAYAGRFDGQGKTLTVNYTGTGQATAPFNQVGGATIENLKTAGTIKQTGTTGSYPQSHASGLVGSAKVVTINNCEVAVAISFTLTGNPDQHSGGFIGHGQGSVITMNNCKFSGSFTGPDGSQTSGIAGLVGWSAGNGSSFTNCYVAGTYKNIVDVHPLVYTYYKDNPTVSSANNYYCFNGIKASTWSTYGTATPVTADQAKSGSVTWSLQHGTEAKVWSQSLPGDNEPMLVFSGAKTVNKVDFVHDKTVRFTRYANIGSKILGTVPTLQDFMGSAYNDTYYYETFSFTPAFTKDSPVSNDTKVTVNLKYSDYFNVNSKDAWNKFCTLVSNGSTKLAAKMTADVNDGVTTMAGTSDHPYQGTFDGQGRTLNVNLNGGKNLAPFSVINGATVKNLSVTGSITASDKYAAGIASWVIGNSAISHCESKVTINSSVSGDGTHGGIVAVSSNGAGVDISNCIFSGEMKGEATNRCGGILGWPSGASTIRHCLVTATFTTGASNSATFTRNAGQATITNSYYLNAYGTAQGEKVNDAQLKDGYVASKLQAGNTDASVWAFSLGGGTKLHALYEKKAAEKQTPNYVYYDGDAQKWRCKNYSITDGSAYQDSYVDFTAERVSYSRSLTTGRRYTWCQPYTVTYSDGLPFKAYRLSDSRGGSAIFTQLNNGETLEAFKPYLIVMNDTKASLDFENEIPVKHYEKDKAASVEAGGISMKGTLRTIENAEAHNIGAYIMQSDNTWKKVIAEKNSDAYIPPFRAYLTSMAHGAKIGSVFSDDITTGVENVILKDSDGTTHIYDLRGVDRGTDFDSLPMGIYIRDGMKIVKK